MLSGTTLTVGSPTIDAAAVMMTLDKPPMMTVIHPEWRRDSYMEKIAALERENDQLRALLGVLLSDVGSHSGATGKTTLFVIPADIERARKAIGGIES